MRDMLMPLLLVWAMAATAQALAWRWQQARRNAGIVDAVWAAGVGASALVLAVAGTGAALPRILLALLGGIWGLRLALHLWQRIRGEPEDGRYARLRERWGDAGTRWFVFFQAQALLVVLFALPFAVVAGNPQGSLHPAFAVAMVVWVVSVAGEAIADRQLARFRADPSRKGQVCRDGLWRYSRHPNYFFEWLHWFAYPLLAWGAPHAWLAWMAPLLMYVFLRWISGVPYTEAQAIRSRGEAYRAYQRSTSVLIPWFPRSTP